MFRPEPRGTLLYPSGPAHDQRRSHLFVLMTAPSGPAGQVLMVPVVTRTDHSDTTCLIAVGAHEFINHESVVEYRHARVERADRLARGVETGELTAREPIDEPVFALIRDGFYQSRFVKPFARDFLDQYGG